MCNELVDSKNKHIYPDKKLFEVDTDYKININERYSIYGDPSRTNKTLLLGHMINDSKSLKIDMEIKNETWTNVKNKIMDYLLESNNNCKTVHNNDSGVCYIKTTKNIKKGEE
jgi:hypothetical protein